MVNDLDMVETGHKHVFAFTSLFIPRIAKSWAGPGNKATHSLDVTSLIDGWARDYQS